MVIDIVLKKVQFMYSGGAKIRIRVLVVVEKSYLQFGYVQGYLAFVTKQKPNILSGVLQKAMAM